MIARLLLLALVGQPAAFVEERRPVLVAQVEATDGGVVLTPPDGGASDAPLRPPELIDAFGNITVLAIPELEPGAVCLTYEKAVIERDNKAACRAGLATMQAGSGIDWPLMLGIAGAGVAMTALGIAIGYFAGQASVQHP